MAVRSAAEHLVSATNESTAEHQAQRTMERLEQAAKQTAYEATQTIAAANQSKVSARTQKGRGMHVRVNVFFESKLR